MTAAPAPPGDPLLPGPAATGPASFDAQPVLAHIETDLFCVGCGYNLRGQPVRRDGPTALLLARCPECGRFHPAGTHTTLGSVWLNRLSKVLLLSWMATLAMLVVVQGAIELGIVSAVISTLAWIPGYRDFVNGNIDLVEATWLAAMVGLIGLFGFASAMAATVVVPHWRWWGYVLFALVRPILVAAMAWWLNVASQYQTENQHMALVATVVVTGYVTLHILGGFLGWSLGRPLARLAVTIVFPGRWRPVLGYLWIADGRTPPTSK